MSRSIRKQQLTPHQKQLLLDKKHKILKNLLYKYEIPHKSLHDQPRQDYFVTYSIVNKISQSGWFSNERLLVLDSKNKLLFYLKNIPQFIYFQSQTNQIQNLHSSQLIKQKISVRSFTKQLKNVSKDNKILIIEWQKGPQQNPSRQKKIWKFQMTSNKLVQDWINLIKSVQTGGFHQNSIVKKILVTPDNMPKVKQYYNNLPSTPKSITDVQSLQMKSQNLNTPPQQDNNKNNALTPVVKPNANNQTQQNQKQKKQFEKFFKKKIKSDQNLEEIKQITSKKRQKRKDIILIDDLASQLNQNALQSPKITRKNGLKYSPLSQEKEQLQRKKFFPSEKQSFSKKEGIKQIYGNKGTHNIESHRSNQSKNNSIFNKYKVKQDQIIMQQLQQQQKNILSQQIINSNRLQYKNYEYLRSNTQFNKNGSNQFSGKKYGTIQKIKKSGNLQLQSKYINQNQLNSNSRKNNSTNTPKKNYQEINEILSKRNQDYIEIKNIDGKFKKINLKKQAYLNSEQQNNSKKIYNPASSDLKNIFDKVQLLTPSQKSRKKAYSPYKNTYQPGTPKPSNLGSLYYWNQIHFENLIEYYNFASVYQQKLSISLLNPRQYNYQKVKNHKNTNLIEKLQDICFKVKKHIQKFQLYCSKGVQLIIQKYILKLKNQNIKSQDTKGPQKLVKIKQQDIYNNDINQWSNRDNVGSFKQTNNLNKINKKNDNKNKKEEQNKKKSLEKIVEFQYEGIQFCFVLSTLKQSNLQKIIYDQYIKLLEINSLHPYFRQIQSQLSSTYNNQFNYFHIFTPLVSIYDYHGVKIFCKALFKQKLYKKYTQLLLDSQYAQYQKMNTQQRQKYQSLSKYIAQRLYKSSFKKGIYSLERKQLLINNVESIFLCKQLNKHNYLIINNLNELTSIQSENNFVYKVINLNYNLSNKRKQINTISNLNKKSGKQQQFIRQRQKNQQFQDTIFERYIEILSNLQYNFIQQCGTKLIEHKDFKQYVNSIFINMFNSQNLIQFYLFVKNYVYQGRSNIDYGIKYDSEEKQLGYFNQERVHKKNIQKYVDKQLGVEQKIAKQNFPRITIPAFSRHFLAYILKLLQNQIFLSLIFQEIKQCTKQFVTLVHLLIQKKVQYKRYKDKQKYINQQQEQQMKLLEKQVSLQQFGQLILKQVVEKKIKKIFVFTKEQANEQQEGNSKKKDDKKSISLNKKWLKSILLHLKQQGGNFTLKTVLKTLDHKYIYDGICQQLHIQQQIDLLQMKNYSYQKLMQMNKSPDNQIQKKMKLKWLKQQSNKEYSQLKKQNKLMSNIMFSLYRIYLQFNKYYKEKFNEEQDNNNQIIVQLLTDSIHISVNQQKKNQSNNHLSNLNINYMGKIFNKYESNIYLTYPIKVLHSLKQSYPTNIFVQSNLLRSKLQNIFQLIQIKQFNKAIQIYYLLIKNIDQNKKRALKNSPSTNNEHIDMQKNQQNPINSLEPIIYTPICSPSILIFLLASQAVSFSFMNILFQSINIGIYTDRLYSQLSQQSFNSSRQRNNISTAQKKQFQSLVIKYNDFSQIGIKNLFGAGHITYLISELIFGYLQYRKQNFASATKYFQQCKRAIQLQPIYYHSKPLSLIILYVKGKVDLKNNHYRSCIQSVRLFMDLIDKIKQKLLNNKNSHYIQNEYWIEEKITSILEISQFPQFSKIKYAQQKFNHYTYLGFQMLYQCNEADPYSELQFNRENIKLDIIEHLSHSPQTAVFNNPNINQKYANLSNNDQTMINFIKLLWNIELKLFNQEYKQLVVDATYKLYKKLIIQQKKQKHIIQYDINIILNPLKTNNISNINYSFVYRLFYQIFSKSQRYWLFILDEFKQDQFYELKQFLQHKLVINNKNSSKVVLLEHYDMKKLLFKEIILILKLILIIGEKEFFKDLISNNKGSILDYEESY